MPNYGLLLSTVLILLNSGPIIHGLPTELVCSTTRNGLRYTPERPLAKPLPRIHVGDPAVQAKLNAGEPFILEGCWTNKTLRDLNAEALARIFPEWEVGIHPNNAYHSISELEPILFREGFAAIMGFGHASAPEKTTLFPGKYVIGTLTYRMLKQLTSGSWAPKLKSVIGYSDEWWMETCLDEEDRDELVRFGSWSMVALGHNGSGMMYHADDFMVPNWHAHLEGRKWWYICDPDQTRCFEAVLGKGDILYYVGDWYHLTQNMETPTTVINLNVVSKGSYIKVATQLRDHCRHNKYQFDFSSKLCDALQDCYELWQGHWNDTAELVTFDSWRVDIPPEVLRARDAFGASDGESV